MAYEANIKFEELLIPEKYIMDFHPEIHIVSADNFYTEAENAAIHISELVREKGYRYRDFYMLCNDMDVRGSVIRRVFDNYEIPLFIDTTKIIYQDPAIQFMLSMLDIIGSRRRIKYVFSMLKTGYGPLGDDAVEKLENYCVKYNIRNGHWKKDFIYGVSDEGEDTLIEINKWRSLVEDFLSKAESIMKGCETVTQKTRALWNFLSEIANIPEKLESSAASLEAAGNIEYAERTGQIWQSIIDIFDQLVEVLGERVISDIDYMNILRQGFEEVRIGILPTNNDQVICGALPRSLTGRVKVMFILGANEGVLPAAAEQNGLLSDDEKRVIEDARGLFLGRTSDFATSEHKLALYLNMKKVEDLLYISFSQMDIDGNVIRPSELVTDMLSQHRELEIEKDLVKEGAPVHLAQNMRSTIQIGRAHV